MWVVYLSLCKPTKPEYKGPNIKQIQLHLTILRSPWRDMWKKKNTAFAHKSFKFTHKSFYICTCKFYVPSQRVLYDKIIKKYIFRSFVIRFTCALNIITFPLNTTAFAHDSDIFTSAVISCFFIHSFSRSNGTNSHLGVFLHFCCKTVHR